MLSFEELEVLLDNGPCMAASLKQLPVICPNNVSIETRPTRTKVTVSARLRPLHSMGCGHIRREVSVRATLRSTGGDEHRAEGGTASNADWTLTGD